MVQKVIHSMIISLGLYVTRKNNLYLHLTQCPQNNCILLKGLHSADIRQAMILATQQPLTVANRQSVKTITIPDGLDYEKFRLSNLSAKLNKTDTRNQ